MWTLQKKLIATAFILSVTVWPLPTYAQSGTLNCASNDKRYHYCRADTQNRVRLVRQYSGSPCDRGYSWGYDYRGIWVDRGCRAEFEFGYDNNRGNNGKDAAVAAGILGAIILGAAAAGSKSDHDDDLAAQRRQYYMDGYRVGQRDWDQNLSPSYQNYRNRFPKQFEADFAAGYDDGYNNRRKAYR